MDYLPSKRASLKAGQFKRVVVLPSMTVMHVPQGPRHPKAPANEEEAWRDPHQKHGEERLHGRCLSTP